MKHEVLYVVIPAYNEADNIQSVINAWNNIITITYAGGGPTTRY